MNTIPFSRPTIGEEEIQAVAEVLRSGWLTTGKQTLAFEREFARAVGARYALAVNSATAGLHLALEACGVGPGDAVVVPSLTFTATAEVVRYLGAEVVFADVDEDSLLISPLSIRAACSRAQSMGLRPAAVVPVHIAGEPAAMAEINAIAADVGAVVVEDAAHALPGHDDDGPLGTRGNVGVFSFYANKTITTGEGGMVVTDDEVIAGRVRIMRSHGIDREAWHRYTTAGVQPPGTPGTRETRSRTVGEPVGEPVGQPHWYYQVVAPGFKYNMPDTAAALGRVQLQRAQEFWRARRRLAHRYRELLSDAAGKGLLHLPAAPEGHSWHLFVVRLVPENLSIDRDQVIEALRDRGIGTSVHYIPLHHMPYWHDRYPESATTLPNTERRYQEILSLPMYPELSAEDQERVVEELTAILSGTGSSCHG